MEVALDVSHQIGVREAVHALLATTEVVRLACVPTSSQLESVFHNGREGMEGMEGRD